MGTISGGNYILSQTGDQADAGIGRGLEYPAKSAGTLGQVPTIGESAIGWEQGQPQIKTASVTISATWSGSAPYTQTVSITGATATSKIDLQPTAAQLQQLIDDGVKALYIENNAGTLTAYAIGAPTSVSMTVQCTLTEVSA